MASFPLLPSSINNRNSDVPILLNLNRLSPVRAYDDFSEYLEPGGSGTFAFYSFIVGLRYI